MSARRSSDVDMSETAHRDVSNPSLLLTGIANRNDPTLQLALGEAAPRESKHQVASAGLMPMDTSSTTNASITLTESLPLPLPVSINSTPKDDQKGTRANAFVKLVQGWENYMSDDRTIDPFPNFQQPLQMLQGLTLCGHPSTDLPRLRQGESGATSAIMHPLAPPALRHTHSSPSQIYSRSSSVFSTSHLANGEDFPPPPIALDPFQRSTSTPSAFRQHSNYSAFGTAGGSAFTLTSQRYSGISPVGREHGAHSAFGPVQFYSMALEDMERTSIEVQDISGWSNDDSADDSVRKQKAGSKRGAASRAARFLSDVRVLRRRRRARGGRENPAQPASVSSGSRGGAEEAEHDEKVARPFDTSVTVITDMGLNPNDSSFLSGSSEMSAIVKVAEHDGTTDCEDDVCTALGQNLSDQEAKEDGSPADQQYQRLDSDVDEEVCYQRIETQFEGESPPIPSRSYQDFFNESLSRNDYARANSKADVEACADTSAMRVIVSSSQKPRFKMAMESIAASPSPSRMERGGEGINLTPLSLESATISPHTTRSSVTGSSSGHTTQATITSTSTGLQSGLSTISETDREVMEANKDAKRRRGLDSLPTIQKTENDGSSNNSSSSNSTNPHRYFSLASSPVTLREGANVPAGRFFTNPPSSDATALLNQPAPLTGSNTNSTSTDSRRSGSTTSPSNSESVPVTHTSSSSASSSEQPPTFVSYLDREASSDLTTFREAMETSSQRAAGNDLEEREASPASEMLELFFEEPTAPSQLRGARLDRFRSRQRPPRSPAKGVRPLKTPPPRSSVSPLYHQQLSPPRNIVDHPDSNISKPHVMRTGLADSSALVTSRSLIDCCGGRIAHTESFDNVAPLIGGGSGPARTESESLVKRRTYQESSIEVMNTGPSDVVSNLVTPEKDGV